MDVDRYIRQAEEAEAEARRAATPEERRTYQDVARLWRQLAERRAVLDASGNAD